MKSCLFFVAAVLTYGARVQTAPHGNESPKVGIAPHLLGGTRMSPLGHDYAVFLKMQTEKRKYIYCNGVRLNSGWLLTAAECLKSDNFTHMTLTFPENGKFVHQQYSLKGLNYVLHPTYDATTQKDNIALVSVDFNKWTDKERHLRLPAKKDDKEKFFNVPLEVVGFQHNTNNGDKEREFVSRFVVEITTYDVCLGLYAPAPSVNEQVCTISYYSSQTQGLHQEDLGAPVVMKGRTLFAIVLRVSPWYGGMDQPIVFDKIHSYVDWISNTTGIRRPD